MRKGVRQRDRWVPRLERLEGRELLSAALELEAHHPDKVPESVTLAEIHRMAAAGQDPVEDASAGDGPSERAAYKLAVPEERTAVSPGISTAMVAPLPEPPRRETAVLDRSETEGPAVTIHNANDTGEAREPFADLGRLEAAPAARPITLTTANISLPGGVAHGAFEPELRLISVPISALPAVLQDDPAVVIERSGRPESSPHFAARISAGQIDAGLAWVSRFWPARSGSQGAPLAPAPRAPLADGSGGAGAAAPPASPAPPRAAEPLPPSPSGADLITDFSPFDRARFEQALAHLLDQLESLGRPWPEQAKGAPRIVPIALSILLLEVARRWYRRRKGPGKTRTWKPRSSVLRGFI